jgi:hypothetical protein
MKKLKNFQRILGVLLTGFIALNSISFTAIAESTDPALFIIDSYTLKGYVGDETDIVLPTEVNGVTITTIWGNAFKDNIAITSIKIPEGYTTLAGSAIRSCTSLKSVSLPNSLTGAIGTFQFRDCPALESVNVPYGINNLNSYAFYGCTNPNLVIDIQSVNITTVGSNAFTNVTGTINTYSQEVYDLVKGKATTANVVLLSGDKFADLKTAVNESKSYIQNSALYTEESYKKLSEAVESGNTLLLNENAEKSEIDDVTSAINKAISGLELKKYSEFDRVYEQAYDIVQNHRYEYTHDSWLKLSTSVAQAKEYKESVTGEINEYIQKQINDLTSSMQWRLEALVPLDKTEVFNELQQAITTAESYGSEDFTEESYAELAKALESAKALTEASSFEDLALAKQAIDTALENLKIKPGIEEEAGEPFTVINKNAVETTLGEFTADEAVAGATKIKITFDCAPDVSFNQYASLEAKATIAGTESYMKFVGTDTTETAGAKGFAIELPLSNAINSGDDVKLVAYTWAWSNASDYVYAVTKVEYINAVGQVVKAVTDRTIALDDLKAAIAEAEKIESANYTEESFAALTAALTAARELPEDSAKADIEAAKTALETAVSGLAEKTDDSSSEPTPDSTPDSESSSDTESTSDSSSKADEESSSKTDNSSSKTDDSNNSTTSKTDSASSNSNANTTSNANSGANGSSNPNTGAASATAAGIILLSAIGVITRKK